MVSSYGKVKGKLAFIVLISALIILTVYTRQTKDNFRVTGTKLSNELLHTSSVPLWEQSLDFDSLNFSNTTGNPAGCYVVPNYIHYVSFGGKPLNYVKLICILAAFKNQNPEKIFFHYDDKNIFTGKYWQVLQTTPGFKDIVVFNKVAVPNEIFGQPLSDGWKNWHGSDIVRIQVLMKYGGMYLDADTYLVKSIDDYRRFEMTVNWDVDQFLGNQVLIAHKDSRFLKKYLDTYKVYEKDKWYYNGGERPTVEILYKEPHLVHRVKELFGADLKYAIKTFQEKWAEWRSMYAIHLLYSHQYLFKNLSTKATFPVELDEDNISFYEVTFRELAYDVYDTAKVNWPKSVNN